MVRVTTTNMTTTLLIQHFLIHTLLGSAVMVAILWPWYEGEEGLPELKD